MISCLSILFNAYFLLVGSVPHGYLSVQVLAWKLRGLIAQIAIAGMAELVKSTAHCPETAEYACVGAGQIEICIGWILYTGY